MKPTLAALTYPSTAYSWRSPHSRAVLKLRSKSSRTASMKGMVFRYCSGVTLVVPCTQMARSCTGENVRQASNLFSPTWVARSQHPARQVKGHAEGTPWSFCRSRSSSARTALAASRSRRARHCRPPWRGAPGRASTRRWMPLQRRDQGRVRVWKAWMPPQRRDRVLDRACLLAAGLFEGDMQDDIPDIKPCYCCCNIFTKQQVTDSVEQGDCGRGPLP